LEKYLNTILEVFVTTLQGVVRLGSRTSCLHRHSHSFTATCHVSGFCWCRKKHRYDLGWVAKQTEKQSWIQQPSLPILHQMPLLSP